MDVIVSNTVSDAAVEFITLTAGVEIPGLRLRENSCKCLQQFAKFYYVRNPQRPVDLRGSVNTGVSEQ